MLSICRGRIFSALAGNGSKSAVLQQALKHCSAFAGFNILDPLWGGQKIFCPYNNMTKLMKRRVQELRPGKEKI
jgi:hypothetical protein